MTLVAPGCATSPSASVAARRGSWPRSSNSMSAGVTDGSPMRPRADVAAERTCSGSSCAKATSSSGRMASAEPSRPAASAARASSSEPEP